MFQFVIVVSGELKTAFSYREDKEKIYVTFSEGGKEYGYLKGNIKLIKDLENDLPFLLYSYERECYNCHKMTKIITYITYNDGTNEDVTFPWDKNRLIENQDIFAHLQDPSIEYYGLNVIGDVETFDRMLMDRYPDKIKKKYSSTLKKAYPMNVCVNCGAGQGNNFVFRYVNERVAEMSPICIVEP